MPAAGAGDESYEQLTSFTQHRGPVYAARFSPTSDLIATAGDDGRVMLWDPSDVKPQDIQQTIDQLQLQRKSSTASSPAEPPVPHRELIGHRGPVRTLAFAPDGRTLASGGQDNLVIVWDVAAGRAIKQLRGHASHVRAVAYSADGEQLLSAGRDAQIKLWRPGEYGETRSLASQDDCKRAFGPLLA